MKLEKARSTPESVHMDLQLTPEQRRLLILIHTYTAPRDDGSQVWLKDLPLRALMYDGIVKKVFDWDYSPTSVFVHGIRRFINISQEGEHDLFELREAGLVDKLRITATEHVPSKAYRSSTEGAAVVADFPEEDRKTIIDLISCLRCENSREVRVTSSEAFYFCKDCESTEHIGLFNIEDVAYVARPYLPRVLGVGSTGGES